MARVNKKGGMTVQEKEDEVEIKECNDMAKAMGITGFAVKGIQRNGRG